MCTLVNMSTSNWNRGARRYHLSQMWYILISSYVFFLFKTFSFMGWSLQFETPFIRRGSFRSLHKYQKYKADSARWRGHGHILLRVNYASLHGAEIHLEEVEFQGGNRREENPCGKNSANRHTECGVYLKKKLLSGEGWGYIALLSFLQEEAGGGLGTVMS